MSSKRSKGGATSEPASEEMEVSVEAEVITESAGSEPEHNSDAW